MRKATGIAAALLLAACATTEEAKQSWAGATYDEAVRAWGPPARSTKLSDGSDVHTWVAEGGPTYATWFFALHIYNQAFKYFRMGYGSALAWIFVVLLLLFTFFQLRLSRRWVYYGGERA